MARIRQIKPEFFFDDDVAQLHPLTRLLFIGLWVLADKEGRLEDRPARIKCQVQPYDNTNTDKQLSDLDAAGFIVRYSSGGKKYIQIRTFKEHQHPHVKELESTIPAPDLHHTSTGPAPGQNDTSTGLVPVENAGIRNTEYGIRNTDTGGGETPPEPPPQTSIQEKPPEPASNLPLQAQVFISAGGEFQPGRLPSGESKRDEAVKQICKIVKATPGSLGLWSSVVKAYCIYHSARGLPGMLDFYRRGEIPGEGGNGSRASPQKPKQSGLQEHLNELREEMQNGERPGKIIDIDVDNSGI